MQGGYIALTQRRGKSGQSLGSTPAASTLASVVIPMCQRKFAAPGIGLEQGALSAEQLETGR